MTTALQSRQERADELAALEDAWYVDLYDRAVAAAGTQQARQDAWTIVYPIETREAALAYAAKLEVNDTTDVAVGQLTSPEPGAPDRSHTHTIVRGPGARA
jgi:hypothetical protein